MALLLLATVGAVTVFASTSLAEHLVSKVSPHLLGYSINALNIPKDVVAPKSGKPSKPDPGGRNIDLSGQTGTGTAQDSDATVVIVKPVKPKAFHGDVRRLPLVKPKIKKERPEPKEPSAELPATAQPDAALQPFAPAVPAPAPSASFPGLDFANWGDGWPPDTNGDVGPNHYIQTVNTSIGIYDKSTGTRLAAFTFDTFFSQSPTGTPCDNSNQGDPVVVYDALSDRWIVSDFAWSNYTSGAMYQCMAVSQTSDPVSGGWYFYAWQTASGGKIPDYPKLGVWPDGIYMSANVFSTTGAGSFQNVQVWAFSRTEMESGVTAHAVSFNLPNKISGTSVFSLLPSNVRNNGSAPPAGTPNYFTSIWGSFRARVWKFHVDYGVPSNSTLTGPTNVTISSFSVGPGTVPENGGNNLDSLSYRLMMQNQYQNLSGIESLWITHTVGNGGSPNIAQVRWYQLNVTSGTIVTSGPVQQSTWAPDSTKHRFMPSLAVDKNGDMAVGYSVSSSTMYPAIRYAGRLANDTLNTLGQGETSLIEGTGFQCCTFSDGTTNNRWGDYSAMTIDPDGCTFWYTNEYYNTQPTTLSQDDWKTRFGSFKFSQCTPNPVGILQGTVTDASNGNPISGALVVAGIYRLKTDASGVYKFANMPTGTYSVDVSASGYSSGSASNVNVTNGGTTIQNFALNRPAVNTSLSVSSAAGTFGGTTTLTATLTQQGGSPLSGKTITFTLNASGFANNTALTNASGVATLASVSLSGINAGTYPNGVGASFAGGGGFNGSSGSNSLVVDKATPVINWSDPAPITYGTPLSATQLNATSLVAGTFTYDPASGTVLPVGNGQPLNTLLTPTDTTNYNSNGATVHIDVLASDTIWVEDATPAGATLLGTNEGWNWISSNPTPFSGALANQSNLINGVHQHYFQGATDTLTVNSGDILIAYVYLDASSPPTEIMLQWNDGTWEHRAYWGANNISYGVDGTNSRRFMGSLPAVGQWVRLEVPASQVGLEGHVLNGMAFTLYDGRATWDHAGKSSGSPTPTPTPTPTPSPSPPGESIWVEDAPPTGATLAGTNEGWNWISSNPTPFSGTLANQSDLISGVHQHYFYGATETLTINTGDTLIAYVYLDPANPASEVVLQWNDGTWEHRAYWGANNLPWGVDGTNSRRFMGALPAAGQWVRLEVPAGLVGLEGQTLNGMAFTLYDGRATWDHAGKSSTPPTPTPTPTPTPPGDTIWVGDATPAGATLLGTNEGWNWISSNPTPFSGALANQSDLINGVHQHYFQGATDTLTVNSGDILIAYVYLDASSPPTEIMLQWNDGTWEHRAYWGANNISYGVDGTNSRRFMGSLPAVGQWVRLEVPASQVGLEGHVLNGLAFTLYDGRATWDHAGKAVP